MISFIVSDLKVCNELLVLWLTFLEWNGCCCCHRFETSGFQFGCMFLVSMHALGLNWGFTYAGQVFCHWALLSVVNWCVGVLAFYLASMDSTGL